MAPTTEQSLREQIELWYAVYQHIHETYEIGIYGIMDHLKPGQRRLVQAIEKHFDWLADQTGVL